MLKLELGIETVHLFLIILCACSPKASFSRLVSSGRSRKDIGEGFNKNSEEKNFGWNSMQISILSSFDRPEVIYEVVLHTCRHMPTSFGRACLLMSISFGRACLLMSIAFERVCRHILIYAE